MPHAAVYGMTYFTAIVNSAKMAFFAVYVHSLPYVGYRVTAATGCLLLARV